MGFLLNQNGFVLGKEMSELPEVVEVGGSRTRFFTIFFVIFHKIECSTSRYFENEQSL